MDELVRGLNRMGVECAAIQATPSLLCEDAVPFIAHLDNEDDAQVPGHFVIVTRVDAARLTIDAIDGSTALERRMNLDRFRRMWSTYAIVTTPSTRPIERCHVLGFVGFVVGALGYFGLSHYAARRKAR